MYMAMPSANVVLPDKMQFPSSGGGTAGGGAAGSAFGWYPDERDGLVSWLRGEFAAANAIIDSLCHHLRSVGEPGEYDGVIGSIQQRRSNWNPVLHMQQYFSVADVFYELQQVMWRRQQHHRGGGGFYDPLKQYKRSGGGGYRQGQRQGHKIEIAVKEGDNSSQEFNSPKNIANGSKFDEKDVTLAKYNDDSSTKTQEDNNSKSLDSQSTLSGNSGSETEDDKCNPNSKGCSDGHTENGTSSTHNLHQKSNVSAIAKTFVGTEILDGKAVNVVDGMKLYEELFDESEVGKMVSLVNDLRTAGRQGQLQGQAFVVSKRPTKGHGREMIQLGLPIADAPCDGEVNSGTSKGLRMEPIPSLFQDFIERLMATQILTVKPDSCIIDIYNEGDHSQPHVWPYWYGRPICVILLTECDMTFGRVIAYNHPGDYRGSIKLSLTPGSMLFMEGKCADFARHAIPSIRKQRILVTLTKSQPKRTTPGDGPRSPSLPVPPSSHWVPPPNHIHHRPMGPKHYVPVPVPVPTTAVLAAPAIGPPSNGIQPIFVPAPPIAFPAPPMALPPAGWAARPNAPPRLLVPGTGVFLPPGSGNSTTQKEKHDDENIDSPKEKVDQEDCNGGSVEITPEEERSDGK